MTPAEAIEQLLGGTPLTREQARGVMDQVMAGESTPVQVAGVLIALRAKGETVEEMAGFVDSMRTHATPLELPDDTIDTCGTGGDRSGTFNISTAAAFVAAGAGIPVAKHGNRAASSRCGSADVLEALGVDITLGADGVRRCIEAAGMGFCFAPTFHPAMRHAGPARRELGVRTVFNVLGPLANPGRVRRQALGVGAPSLAPLMIRVLKDLGHERALVFYGDDGLDELTTTGSSRVFQLKAGTLTEYELDPQELGFKRSRPAELQGGAPPENAKLLRQVLDGERGPRRDVVLLNAAAAVLAAGRAEEWPEAIAVATASLDGGRARQVLDRLVETSTAS
ncbi:MAG: anthranilate phosphoribosyltransferase [Chloroflexi bacterium]|nr:MAG: anthranilate phosphoribosyltransferase [Chloroflexota bacterium]TMD66863.1 MAG: anthranilate phosphoribosyltransferase [Chloroflexota bacterium]